MDGYIVISLSHHVEAPKAKSDIKIITKDNEEIIIPVLVAKYDREAIINQVTQFLDVLEKDFADDVRVPA